MRVKYYTRTLRQMNLKRSFVFFLVFFVLFATCANFCAKKVEPTIKNICSDNAKSMALRCSNEAINKNIEGITYDTLIIVNKDTAGKVTSLNANSVEINRLTAKITDDIEENLLNCRKEKVAIPVGMFFNEGIFSAYGPKINIKTYPVGEVKASLKSSFESVGINQTKHSLILEVDAQVKIFAPFVTQTEEYKNSIVIAETIIVSDIPATYYNISGIDNIAPKDTLDLM